MGLLAKAREILDEKGFEPSNVDVVIVTEAPKIGPRSGAMREKLSEVLGIPVTAVSVKGKSNEGMGWIGAREGLAVHAVAIVTKKESGTR